MTKRTRLFLLIAAGVLVVGLGTGLVASFMGLPAMALVGSDGPSELKYVPVDAKVVAYANVRDVMNSQLRQKIREVRPEGEHHDDFKDKTGIDIENDIDIVVAAIGAGAAERDNENPLVVARGRFDAVRIEGLVREHGGQVSAYKGKRLFTHAKRSDSHEMALTFMEPGLVALGSSAAVRRAIDCQESGRDNITDNAEVMGLVRDIDDGNAWAVGRFDAIADRARLPREVALQLPPITWFSASGHVNGGVNGIIRAEARDEAAAQNLRDVIRGFMALAKMQAGARPELNSMMESLQLGGEGKTVSLAFSLPTEIIDLLGAAAGRRRDVDPDPDFDFDPPPPAPPHPPAPPPPPRPRM
jgi:hypothetical protein